MKREGGTPDTRNPHLQEKTTILLRFNNTSFATKTPFGRTPI